MPKDRVFIGLEDLGDLEDEPHDLPGPELYQWQVENKMKIWVLLKKYVGNRCYGSLGMSFIESK